MGRKINSCYLSARKFQGTVKCLWHNENEENSTNNKIQQFQWTYSTTVKDVGYEEKYFGFKTSKHLTITV